MPGNRITLLVDNPDGNPDLFAGNGGTVLGYSSVFPDLIAIRYLEALQNIADGQATKIFLPMEMSGILSSVGVIGELFNKDGEANQG